MKNYSIWKDLKNITTFPQLNKNIKVDVLIIGGGITGISTLYNLKDSKMKTILVEQNKIGMSTTSGSTGKLSFLQNDLLNKIRNNFGDDILKKYINSQKEAIDIIRKNIKDSHISCNLEKVSSKLYTNNINEIDSIKKLKNFLEKCNIKVRETTSNLVESKYMIEVDETYTFHPLKYIYGLAKNLKNIYENTSIKKIIKEKEYYLCSTDTNTIKAKYVIIASHYPYFNIPFIFPIKGTLEKSYLSASKYKKEKISLISYSNPFISIRNYNNYLIYLTNSHSINKNTNDKDNFNELLKKIKDLNLSPDYLWSNIDIMTNDGLPYIGKIKDNILIATGYNTWGLTNGVLAGKILSDIILQKNNPYCDLFNPKRTNSKQVLGIIDSSYKNISGYISGLTNSNNNLKCPHMGCKLIYNEIENTYDCPCHGSRFNMDGQVIMSPSNKNINVNQNKKDI